MPTFNFETGGKRYKIEAVDKDAAVLGLKEHLSTPTVEPERLTRDGVLGKAGAAARGALDTMSIGTSDEIAAGIGAATGIGGTFGDYERNLARQRAIMAEDEKYHDKSRLLGQVGGGVVGGMGLARAGLALTPRLAGASAWLRYPAAAAEGALAAAAHGFGSGEDNFTTRMRKARQEAPMGAAGGAIGERLAPVVQSAVRGATGLAQGVGRAIGVLPDPLPTAKAQLSAALGIDIDQIPDAMAEQYLRQARDLAPDQAAQAVSGNEFGIDYTRGQQTRNIRDLQDEEAMRQGARGTLAQRHIRGRDEAQAAALEHQRQRMLGQFNDGRPVITDSQNELMEGVLGGVRDARQRSLEGVDAAYDTARAGGAVVQRRAVQDLSQAVRRGLREQDVLIAQPLHPYAAQALAAVDDLSNLRGPIVNPASGGPPPAPGSITGVSLEGIETVRQRLNRLWENAAGNPADRLGVRSVIRAFDDWEADAAVNGLLAGTPEGIRLYQAARRARTQHGQRFESSPRQRDEDAGKVIERLIEKDVTAPEVAAMIMGVAKAGERGQAARTALRLREVLGPGSEEWNAIRQATFLRLTTHKADGTPLRDGGRPTAEAIANRINDFVAGKAEPYARILFSPQELGQIRRLGVAVSRTVTPREALNPSGSAWALAREGQSALQNVLTVLGGVTGGAGGALGMRIGPKLVKELAGWQAARKASQGVPRPLYRPQVRGAVAGAAAGAVNDQDDRR